MSSYRPSFPRKRETGLRVQRQAIVQTMIFFFLISLLSVTVNAEESNDQTYILFFEQTVSRLLPGYRCPGDADQNLYWKMKGSYVYKTTDDEKKNKAPYGTKGRFTDDDIEDYAYILINV